MAYNKKNYYKRIIEVQKIALHHNNNGLFFKEIYHTYIENQYSISKRTFDNWLGINAKRELKKILENENNN